jgi:NADH-quinone oxidoreductase subunit J
MYKAYFLLFTLLGVAAIFILGRADFVAASQIMVYAGGILILIIFSLLFTGETHREILPFNRLGLLTSIIGVFVVSVFMIYIINQVNFDQINSGVNNSSQILPSNQAFSTIKIIGTELLTTYLVPFEFVGIFLLAILAGVSFLNSAKDKE